MTAGLTEKLLGYLNRVWSRNPKDVLSLRLNCDGKGMTWQIRDNVLTTLPVGGTASPLTVDLSLYTILSLGYFLGMQQGYLVPYLDEEIVGPLSAFALRDQIGNVSLSNGDHIYAATNPTWAILGAFARELAAARAQIAQMLLQMQIPTAEGEWLDLQGSYYDVPRTVGETDGSYGPRIIPQVLLPRGNNVAIANVITAVLGQPVRVVDVVDYSPVEPLFGGGVNFDGSHDYDSASHLRYGLFDVTVGQDLLGSGLPLPTAQLQALVENVRDAGTQMRSLSGTPSALADTAPLPTSDAATMTVTRATLFNGAYQFYGAASYSGSVAETETLLD
jgi:hypothetical protein